MDQFKTRPVIVLVDDDLSVRDVTEAMLRRLFDQYDFVIASGVREAIERFRRFGNGALCSDQGPVVILVTDFQMPDGTGLDLIHALSQPPSPRFFGAVVVTGFTSINRVTLPEGTQVLAKPFRIDALRRVVTEAFQRATEG